MNQIIFMLAAVLFISCKDNSQKSIVKQEKESTVIEVEQSNSTAVASENTNSNSEAQSSSQVTETSSSTNDKIKTENVDLKKDEEAVVQKQVEGVEKKVIGNKNSDSNTIQETEEIGQVVTSERIKTLPTGSSKAEEKTVGNPTRPIEKVEKPDEPVVNPTKPAAEVALIEDQIENEVQDGRSSTNRREARTKPDHYDMDRLLQKFVSADGSVDYAGIKADPMLLDEFIRELENYPIKDDWERNEKLTYWVNAYNVYTLKLIVDNYPLSKITDLENGKPWDKKWISLGGNTYSLNQIENKIIRPQFNDPRIHFALNCAAVSCPPLLNQAYLPSNIEKLMEQQTKKFINDPARTVIKGGEITISKIFDWYSDDFGNIHAYLSKYYSGSVPKANINYSEYNWALNKK